MYLLLYFAIFSNLNKVEIKLILTAVFITEMVILFKHVIIIIICKRREIGESSDQLSESESDS